MEINYYTGSCKTLALHLISTLSSNICFIEGPLLSVVVVFLLFPVKRRSSLVNTHGTDINISSCQSNQENDKFAVVRKDFL